MCLLIHVTSQSSNYSPYMGSTLPDQDQHHPRSEGQKIMSTQQGGLSTNDDPERNTTSQKRLPVHAQNQSIDQSVPRDTDLYVICRFRPPLLSYNNASFDLPTTFTQETEPPYKWTFTVHDFKQEWTTILWIGRSLDAAEAQLFQEAMEWKTQSGYTYVISNEREISMYEGQDVNDFGYRGKLFIDGPFMDANN